jgi:hypothetical protein
MLIMFSTVLDKLIERREAGTPQQFVKRHIASSRNNRRFTLHRTSANSSFMIRNATHRGKIIDHFSTLRSFFS